MTFNATYRQSGGAFHPPRLGLIAFAPNDASPLNWTPARSIERMDRVGTRTAMTSIWNPGTWLFAAVVILAFATEPKRNILGDVSL